MSFTLGRDWRRTVLALHVLCGVGWMGADLVLGVLAYTGRLSDDGPTVAGAYTAIRLFVPATVPALATGMLVTGLLLGWGTRWGLLQWTWVTVKLAIGVLVFALVYVALLPAALGLEPPPTGDADAIRDAVGRTGVDLLFPPVVSFVLLGTSLVLAIWKPWGRTPWARRSSGAATPPSGPGSR